MEYSNTIGLPGQISTLELRKDLILKMINKNNHAVFSLDSEHAEDLVVIGNEVVRLHRAIALFAVRQELNFC
jgi:hypothetical protein